VALVLADVAGKGMPAALLMASLHGVIRAQAAAMAGRLGEFVSAINALLHRDGDRTSYATLFYGVYDDETRVLEYVNAGHPPALVVRARDGSAIPLGAVCPPAGMFHAVDAVPKRIELEPGDWLVVYSDGASEAVNANGDEFGCQGLIDLVVRLESESAQGLCDGVLEALAEHQAGARQRDDITLLAARVREAAS
jgi:sigma-B regulation protein RsbU (phosphoserine phosphatase)